MTDLIAERALAFIDKNAGRRFFLEVAFNAPHFPFQLPGRPDDVRTLRKYGPQNGTRADYVQMVQHLDHRIAELLLSIDDHKLTTSTLVVFVSDNGGDRLSSNAPFSGGKFTLFEGGIRVPCLIRWPGVITPGTLSRQAVMTMDLAATILAACGVRPAPPRALDGIDIMPILTDKAAERAHLFWRIHNISGSTSVPTGVVSSMDGATKLGDFRLVNGTATFTTSLLTVGVHSITAVSTATRILRQSPRLHFRSQSNRGEHLQYDIFDSPLNARPTPVSIETPLLGLRNAVAMSVKCDRQLTLMASS